MDATLASDLLDLERAGWDSLCNGTGHDFYGRMMTDDGRMVLANGTVMTRDDVVASLRDAPTWASYSIDDVQVIRLADDVAALVYRGTGAREAGEDHDFTGVMSSVYVRNDDGWRLALYQQTAMP